MKLHSEQRTGNFIESVSGTGVMLNGRLLCGNVIIAPDSVIENWLPDSTGMPSLADFRQALDLDPEVILFGTGASHRYPGNHLVTAIMAQGIGFEVMATPAACRTFNVLLAEDRRVIAALLPI
jgi:uncharacterized protein